MSVASASTAPIRFRHSGALWAAAMLTFVGGTPLALAIPNGLGLPLFLFPISLAVWAWRAGVDAGGEGIRVRGLLGSRRFAWSDLDGFGVAGRKAFVVLKEGVRVPLPAVRRQDLPRLIAASGNDLVTADEDAADTEDTED